MKPLAPSLASIVAFGAALILASCDGLPTPTPVPTSTPRPLLPVANCTNRYETGLDKPDAENILLYPGAKDVQGRNLAPDVQGILNCTLSYFATANPQDIAQYYKSNLEMYGWNAGIGPGASAEGETIEHGLNFWHSVTVGPSEDLEYLTITATVQSGGTIRVGARGYGRTEAILLLNCHDTVP